MSSNKRSTNSDDVSSKRVADEALAEKRKQREAAFKAFADATDSIPRLSPYTGRSVFVTFVGLEDSGLTQLRIPTHFISAEDLEALTAYQDKQKLHDLVDYSTADDLNEPVGRLLVRSGLVKSPRGVKADLATYLQLLDNAKLELRPIETLFPALVVTLVSSLVPSLGDALLDDSDEEPPAVPEGVKE
jgi:hypothetical protein